ncbi:MAG: tetratricopeptide repeat protein [Planctomycetes bacterium]|nr:tetratricopeptide repeat protein [Planctomycetota bacterium]
MKSRAVRRGEGRGPWRPRLRRLRVPDLVLPLALFASLLAGCRSAPVPDARPGADPVYAQAEAAFLAGSWDAAIAAYTKFLSTPGAVAFAPETHLRIAACHLAAGRPTQALPALDRALPNAAFPWLQAEVLATRGDAHRLLGDLPRAESDYRRALEAAPREVREAEVRFHLAQVLARAGRWEDSRAEMRSVAARFPSSSFAPLAAERAALADRSFWVQLGLFPEPADARARCRDLATRGLRATIAPLLASGRTLSAVRIGPYETYEAAERAARDARAAGVGAAEVVP